MTHPSTVADTLDARPARSRGFDWYRLLPWYWIQNDRTDREWDAVLNDLLDRYTLSESLYCAHLGPVTVWASNWPYAYGTAYHPVELHGLPMVRTRKRLRAAVRNAKLSPIRNAIAKARGEVQP